jgi:hypothetical protein
MTKIVNIGGLPSSRGREPVPEIVDALTDLLERARSGDLRLLAYVYVDGTGRPTDQFVPGATPEETLPIIAGLELCKATLLSQMVDA